MAQGLSLGPLALVAAPRDVRRPDLARAEPEPWRPRDQQEGVVVAGPAVARLARPRSVAERQSLRSPLMRPQPGEVEHLAGAVRGRQGRVERHQHERVVTPVLEGAADAEDAVLGELDVGRHRERARGVGQAQPDRAVAHRLGAGHDQRSRRLPRAGPEALEARPPRPPLLTGRQDRQAQRDVDRARRDGRDQRRREPGEGVVVERAEVAPPVQDGGEVPTAPHRDVEHEARPCCAQVLDHAVTWRRGWTATRASRSSIPAPTRATRGASPTRRPRP